MISHARAQALISARLDEALSAADSQVLQTHLLACVTCRRFAEQSDALGRGLRALPHLPASPNVSRQVMEAVNAGRSPWAFLSFGMRLASGPALATVGSLVLVAALAFTVVLALNPPGGGQGDAPTAVNAPLAQQPSTRVPAAAATTATTATATAAAEMATAIPAAAAERRDEAGGALVTPSPTAVPPVPTARINVTATRTPTPAGEAVAALGESTAAPGKDGASTVAPTPTAPPPAAAAAGGDQGSIVPPTAPPTPESAVALPPATAAPADNVAATVAPTSASEAPTETPEPTPAPTDVPIATAPPPVTAAEATLPAEPPPSIVEVATEPTTTPVLLATATATAAAAAEAPLLPPTAIPAPTLEPSPAPEAPTETLEPMPAPIVAVTSVPTAAVVEVDGGSAAEGPVAPVAPTIAPLAGQEAEVDGPQAPAPSASAAPEAAVVPTALPSDEDAFSAPSVGAATPVAAAGALADEVPAESAPVAETSPPVERGAGDEAAIPVEVDPAAAVPGGGAVATVDPAETGVVGGSVPVVEDAEAVEGVPAIEPTDGTTPVPVSRSAVESVVESTEVATIATEAAPAVIRAGRARAREQRATREAAPATIAPGGEDVAAAETASSVTLPIAALDGGDAFTPVGAVATEDGSGVTVTEPTGGTTALAGAASPVWSPLGAVLLVTMPNPESGRPSIAFWERGASGPGPLPESLTDDGRYRDLPAGWSESVAYYQRVYEDGSGRVELRADDILTEAGFETIWSGTAGDAGVFGQGVSAARVSPDGSRIAFVADGRLYAAATAEPGRSASAVGGAVVGFDWSPGSDRLAVSDGDALTIYDAAGVLLESGWGGDGGLGAPVWREDGIYVPRLDGSGELLLVAS